MKIVNRSEVTESDLTVDRIHEFIGEAPEKLGIMGSLEGITYRTKESIKKLIHAWQYYLAQCREEQIELERS